MNFEGRWVLVTGASAGLGREMARVLAKKYRAKLVIVARRMERLTALKTELEKETGSEVLAIAADLSEAEGVERTFAEATQGRALYAAILNAGATHFGDWDEQSWESTERMLDLNVRRLVQLSRLLLPHFEQQKCGAGLMLVGSLAGTVPTPYQSTYAASKAFVNQFGRGLHHEMADRGVSVTTFLPGGIDTEMTSGRRFNELRNWLMPVERCARLAVEAFRKREYGPSPGITYGASALLTHLLPQRVLGFGLGRVYRRSLDANR